MHVSLSEIQTTVCKAAVAVGLPLGLGEDAGWAARRMMAIGVGSFAAFVDAIDTVDDGRSTGFDADHAIAGSFGPQPAGLLLSAIRAGPSVCDLVALATGTDIEFAPLTLTDVDIPSVILFEVLAATATPLGSEVIPPPASEAAGPSWAARLNATKMARKPTTRGDLVINEIGRSWETMEQAERKGPRGQEIT